MQLLEPRFKNTSQTPYSAQLTSHKGLPMAYKSLHDQISFPALFPSLVTLAFLLIPELS